MNAPRSVLTLRVLPAGSDEAHEPVYAGHRGVEYGAERWESTDAQRLALRCVADPPPACKCSLGGQCVFCVNGCNAPCVIIHFV